MDLCHDYDTVFIYDANIEGVASEILLFSWEIRGIWGIPH